MIEEQIRKLKLFLINPSKAIYPETKGRLPLKTVLTNFLVFDVLLIFSFGILNSILTFLFDDYKILYNDRNIATNPYINRFWIIAIIAPIIEEFAFRFGLNVKKSTLAVSIGVQLIIILGLLNIGAPFHIRILLIPFFCLSVYFIMKGKQIQFLQRHQKLFIYYNILSFGLLHALNYNYQEFWYIIFIPFLISTQTVLGVYFSYLRLKYSFILVLMLHVIHNTVLFSLASIIKSITEI